MVFQPMQSHGLRTRPRRLSRPARTGTSLRGARTRPRIKTPTNTLSTAGGAHAAIGPPPHRWTGRYSAAGPSPADLRCGTELVVPRPKSCTATPPAAAAAAAAAGGAKNHKGHSRGERVDSSHTGSRQNTDAKRSLLSPRTCSKTCPPRHESRKKHSSRSSKAEKLLQL